MRKSLFDMSGKSALITGGSRGLGLQIAEALGAEGPGPPGSPGSYGGHTGCA